MAFIEEWLSLRASKILPYLAKEHEIHYIASGVDIPQADFASVKLFKFPRYQQQNSLHIARAAQALFRRNVIDFVVDYSYMGWALQKVPFVEIVGGLYHNDFLPKWRAASWLSRPRMSLGYLHYCLPEHICIKRAGQIVTDNLVNAETMHKKFGKPLERIAVIPNGVDEAFSALYTAKDFSRPVLLFVGNLHPGKGILLVLQRFSECKHLDVPFVVCGDGPDRAAIEALAKQDSRISYRGRVSHEELIEIEKGTTIFVFPSLAEGCPNALLEAMASGHACITYDVDTVQLVVKDTGLEAQANNVNQVMNLILKLMQNRSLLQSKAAAAHDESRNYSWSGCALQFGKIINLFCAEHPATLVNVK
ncbi:MAG: glycosyltransferase family 4 protein [Chlorobium sp.]|nr:glycosyltransferase family 4 protein [Chlorobium sp.]